MARGGSAHAVYRKGDNRIEMPMSYEACKQMFRQWAAFILRVPVDKTTLPILRSRGNVVAEACNIERALHNGRTDTGADTSQ